MTLTEQWTKGELPEGFYYVDDGAEVTIDYYLCDYWERHFDRDVHQVLAPVPSYEEYQKLKTENKALKKENDKLKQAIYEFGGMKCCKCGEYHHRHYVCWHCGYDCTAPKELDK